MRASDGNMVQSASFLQRGEARRLHHLGGVRERTPGTAAQPTRMGVQHGMYCLGCCWALMALLFVGGAMNLLWIAALTLLVAIEKLAPKGDMIAKALGVLMIGAGVAR